MQSTVHFHGYLLTFQTGMPSCGLFQHSRSYGGFHECFSPCRLTCKPRYASCCRIKAVTRGRTEYQKHCTSLTAGIAAACLLLTQPAHAELFGQTSQIRQSRAPSTVTVDRAWLESLLLDELGSRINSLSDDELMVMLEQLVRSKQPGSSQRPAASDTPPGVTNPLQGMGFAWPWAQRQAPELQGVTGNEGDKVLERMTGSLPGWLRGGGDTAADVSAADQQPANSAAIAVPDASQPEIVTHAPSALLKDLEAASSSTGDVQHREEQQMPTSQSRNGEAAPPRASLSTGSPSASPGEGQVAGSAEAARAADQARSIETADALEKREEDLTGSLLKASGLPLRLREDGLPEASTSGAEERPLQGKVFLERARHAAGSAAASVAAAIASGLQSVPEDGPFQGLAAGTDSGVPAVVENALRIALLAGVGVGTYALLPLLGFDTANDPGKGDPADDAASGGPTQPAAQRQHVHEAETSQAPRKLPTAWDVLKLVPSTLLGFPISMSSPSAAAASVIPEAPPSSFSQGEPDIMQHPPMGPPSPYGGPATPSRPNAPDSTILWRLDDAHSSSRQRSVGTANGAAAAAGNLLWVRDEAAQAARSAAGAQSSSGVQDSTVLWRREDSAEPRALTFPQHSAVRDRDAESGNRNGLQELASTEADPWTAPQQPQTSVSLNGALAQEWIYMHTALQPRGEDPWRDTDADTTQQISGRTSTAQGDSTAAVGTANAVGAVERGEYGRRYPAGPGFGQGNGWPRGKGRLKDKSALYNNVEQVPSVGYQGSEHMCK